ncbi:MAG TPA: SH3 domain-containing protein [Solimonas sp.]
METRSTDEFIESIRRMHESPALRAIRDIEQSVNLTKAAQSATLQMLLDLERTSMAVQVRHIEGYSLLDTFGDLNLSPAMKSIRDFDRQEKPMFGSIAKALEQSRIDKLVNPQIEAAVAAFENSNLFKVVESLRKSASFRAIDQLAETLATGHLGPLTLGSAFDEVLRTYRGIEDTDCFGSLDGLADDVVARVKASPSGRLSKEFYLSLLISLVLFLLSQASSVESEERIINRIDQMQEVVLAELEKIEREEANETFYVVLRPLRLRGGPSMATETITVLPPNLKVRLVERAGKWIKIEYFDYPSNEYVVGWSFKKYLKILNPKGSRREP